MELIGWEGELRNWSPEWSPELTLCLLQVHRTLLLRTLSMGSN